MVQVIDRFGDHNQCSKSEFQCIFLLDFNNYRKALLVQKQQVYLGQSCVLQSGRPLNACSIPFAHCYNLTGHVMLLMCPSTLLQIIQNPGTQRAGLAAIVLL